jgi:tetratricopeptide (TPR) repeat protein
VALGLETAAAQHRAHVISLQETRRWLERLLALPAALPPTRARARALTALGELAWLQGDYTTARQAAEESVALWRVIGEQEGLAIALHTWAKCSLDGADAAANSAAEEALRLAQAMRSPVATAFAHNAAGILARRRQDWPVARAAFARAAESARVEEAFHASHLVNVAVVDSRLGDETRAAAGLTEALELMRRSGAAPQWLMAASLANLGHIAFRRRDPDRAAAYWGEALALSEQSGSLAGVGLAIVGLGRVAFLRQEWAQEAQRFGAAPPGHVVRARALRRGCQSSPG